MNMNAQKRTWISSAFRQLSSSQDNSLEADESQAESKRLKHHASDTSFALNITTAIKDIEILSKPKEKGMDNSSKSITNNSNWLESFAPKSIEDVAVHPKKMAELQNWLQHCDAVRRQHPAQLCLLTGPSGAGKTTAARATAQSCSYHLQEWINPLDQEIIHTLGDQSKGNAYVGSQLDAFKSFLLRASRYKSLLEQFNKRLLLVEDFPNALLSDATLFETILDEYSKYGKAPLLFIVADSKSRALNISYNLFTEQLKNKFHIQHISFNPVAPTLLQKAMKRFCALMRQPMHADTYQVPAQTVVDSIVVAAQGDIRNALLNLHFASLKGAVPIALKGLTTLEVNKSRQKNSKRQQSTLKSIGRDESITVLHALGRVFNPKCGVDHRFVHSPEEISENFSTEPKKFIDLLHSNYLPHFSDIEQVVEAANGLSISDVILNEYREDALSLTSVNVAVRSLMVANTAPVPGWMPVRGQNRWQQSVAQQKSALRQQLCGNVSPNLYASDYSTYVRLISSDKFKQ